MRQQKPWGDYVRSRSFDGRIAPRIIAMSTGEVEGAVQENGLTKRMQK